VPLPEARDSQVVPCCALQVLPAPFTPPPEQEHTEIEIQARVSAQQIASFMIVLNGRESNLVLPDL
jgi:hypothetical protein